MSDEVVPRTTNTLDAASAAATDDGPLITSSSSSELCWSYKRWDWHIIAEDADEEQAVSVVGEFTSAQELKPKERREMWLGILYNK